MSVAVVLGQVDRKFVACVIPSSDFAEGGIHAEAAHAGILVLLDQHAADERIRVERFMRELCKGFSTNAEGAGSGPDVRTLDPPVRIVLTRHEADMLSSVEVQAAFRCWGVTFGPIPEAPEEEESVSRFFSTKKTVKFVEHSGYVQVDVLSVPEVVAGKVSSVLHIIAFGTLII